MKKIIIRKMRRKRFFSLIVRFQKETIQNIPELIPAMM